MEVAESAESDVGSGVPQDLYSGGSAVPVNIAAISGVLSHSIASSFAKDTWLIQSIKRVIDYISCFKFTLRQSSGEQWLTRRSTGIHFNCYGERCT